MDSHEVFTIGHSTRTYEAFLQLLREAGVTAVADVRSAPYSRQQPQFNKEALQKALRADGIAYVFLGKELGGRPSDTRLFCDGVADYEKMSQTSEFCEGISRVIEGSDKFKIALMCSERHPLNCHRCLLVGRALSDRGLQVRHIISSSDLISQKDVEDALLQESGRGPEDFFSSRTEQLAEAYRERARKVAFAATNGSTTRAHA